MKLNLSFSLGFALLGLFLGTVASEEVITLTKDNFESAIAENPFILVEFYAPWCGHCKKLAPEYEKAAKIAKELEPKVVLAKVDATAEDKLASEFGVKGFPTLKWFVDGKVSDYTGGRDEKTIVSWIKKKTGPPAKTLKDVESLDKLKKEASAVVVGFFNNEKEAEAYISVAKASEDVPFGVCYENCGPLAAQADIEASQFPAIVMFQDFDAGKAVFDKDITKSEDITLFISANSLPLIIPFSQKNAPKIFGGEIKDQLLVFVKGQDDEDSKALLEKLRPIAEKEKGVIMFVSVAVTETRITEFFGVKSEDAPTARMVNMAEGVKKYRLENDLTVENVEKFVADYKEGTLAIDLKSEEPLPESEQGPVRVLVGKDFEAIVNQPGKDVLVEFYAPWCGHCKKLEPEYNGLGEHFKDNENVIIAKMDATANEVERVQVSGFPTLKFFPADSEEIVDYDGARNKDGMIEFLNKNAKSLQ